MKILITTLCLFSILLSSCCNLSLEARYDKTKELYTNNSVNIVSRKSILHTLEDLNLEEFKGKCIIVFAGIGKFGGGKNECLLVSFLTDNIEPDSLIIKFHQDTNDVIIMRIQDELLPYMHQQLKEVIAYDLLFSLDRNILNLRQGDKIALMSVKDGGIILSNWMELSEVENIKTKNY